MFRDPPLFLGGPVFARELVRAQRHRWLALPFAIYLAWLAATFVLFVVEVERGSAEAVSYGRTTASFEADRRARAASDYVSFHLRQFMILLVFLLPAAVSSRLSQEKERNTLLALLGTELTENSILAGKLFGAPGWLARLGLLGLPLL